MAKRIIWSARAKEEKKGILAFWRKKNMSNVYPNKLNRLFKIAVKSIAQSPIPRKKSNYADVFVKIVRDYLIIFEEDKSTIFILSIWDTRQDPEKLRQIFE